MSHLFDPGYSAEPFCTLCAEYPEADVYPQASFALSGDQSSIAVASTVQRAWLPARFLPFQTDRLVGEIHHVRCAPASSVRVFCSAEGRLGIGIAEKIEDELANYAAIAECKAVAMLGIAHGWAGFLYALMQWKRTQGKEPGDGIRARLQQLEELGEERGTLLRTARISAKWIIPVIESRKSDFPSLGFREACTILPSVLPHGSSGEWNPCWRN